MSNLKATKRNANRPTKDRGAYIQGSTSSGAKSEAKDLELQRQLDEWHELARKNK